MRFVRVFFRIKRRGILKVTARELNGKRGFEFAVLNMQNLRKRATTLSVRGTNNPNGVTKPLWREVSGGLGILLYGTGITSVTSSIDRSVPGALMVMGGLMGYYNLTFKTLEDALTQAVYILTLEHFMKVPEDRSFFISYDKFEELENELRNNVSNPW